MKNSSQLEIPSLVSSETTRREENRSDVTLNLTQGITRLLWNMGFSVLPEFSLPTGRRVDLAGLNRQGEFLFVEIKSCRADFDTDTKWPTYLEFCDQLFFGIDETFPRQILPPGQGLIVADKFTGVIINSAPETPIAPARRKAMTLRYARQAAGRL